MPAICGGGWGKGQQVREWAVGAGVASQPGHNRWRAMRLPLLLTAWHLFQCIPAPDSMPVVRLQPEPCTGLCCHSQVARPVTMPAPPKTRIQVGTGTFLPGTAAFCLRSGRSRWNGQGEVRVGCPLGRCPHSRQPPGSGTPFPQPCNVAVQNSPNIIDRRKRPSIKERGDRERPCRSWEGRGGVPDSGCRPQHGCARAHMCARLQACCISTPEQPRLLP